MTCALVWIALGLFSFYNYWESQKNINDPTHTVSHYLRKTEREIKSTLADKEVVDVMLRWAEGNLVPDENSEEILTKLHAAPFSLGVVSEGRLKAWTADFTRVNAQEFVKGKYWLVNDSTFQHLWSVPGYSGESFFLTEFSLPGRFSMSPPDGKKEGANYLKDGDDKKIAYITSSHSIASDQGILWTLPLYFLGYLLLFWALNDSLKKRKSRFNPYNLILPLLIVLGIRSLDILSGLSPAIDQALIAEGVAGKPILSSWYGHWILIICLYFILIEEVLRKIPPLKYLKKIKFVTIKYAAFAYTVDYLGLVGILIFCRELVVKSGLNFDFNNVLNQGKGPMMSLFLLSVLLFRYFVFAFNINKSLLDNGVRLRKKLIGMVIGFLLVLPCLLLTNLDLPLLMLLLVTMLFALLFDIFIGSQSPSLGWLVIWILFFSMFSTIALFKFNKDKDQKERKMILTSLSDRDDSILMKEFGDFVLQLKNNRQHNEDFSSAILTCNQAQAVELVGEVLNQFDYSRQYYNVDFFIRQNDTVCIRSQNGLDAFFDRAPVRFTETKTFLKGEIADLYHSYWMKIYWQGVREKPSPEVYFLVSKKTIIPRQRDFEPNKSFMGLNHLDKYDYAIFYKGSLIESQGYIYPDRITSDPGLPKVDQPKEVTVNGRSEMQASPGENYTIIVGRELLGLLKPVSLCSLLIVILLFLIICLAIVNSYFRILPDGLPILLPGQFNLRQRIEYSIILVIMISFVIIAVITGNYFRNLSLRMEESRLKDKIFSIATDVEAVLNKTRLDSLDALMMQKIALNHRTEYSIYNFKGREVFNARPPDRRGRHWRMMPPNPYLSLSVDNRSILFDLSSDKRSIRAAYVRLNRSADFNPAWIAVPYSEANTSSFFAASDFLGTLLNVYIFLLLVAGGIAYFVANSVTKPLVRLMENLKQIKLGKKNEQLQWEQQDEIGTLIYEYNNMINQLEESADLLVKSEREGAWRDMAQQVAHEIKNPLTPMKLSIQYLERKIMMLSGDEARQIVKDTAKTIIEQIDNLASIASEFSNFAKMPAPVIEQLNFNEMVTSIYELFRKKDDVVFSLRVPMDDVMILADKSQMMRVLNNLLQNAIQSIPHDRSGRIDLELRTIGHHAVLSVKDNGEGIPKEMHQKVFYPRFTTKNSGMGLGLAMCKSIIDSVHGTITFKTKLNAGTEFIISIPLAHNPDADLPGRGK
ncbi:MAG: GHKL domain-containing protein [Saprospiraceae bacterium]|nr:GHKL domain-containing protein [Saprospiraceae bacterium]